jgi:uncharacterized protein YdcH (DUF465 family)
MSVEPTESQASLVSTEAEYQELVARHRALEGRLSELTHKTHLSEPEQLEAATIKKRKLQLKDKMEDLSKRLKIDGSPSALTA